jgi:hypothetical protein
MSGIGRTEAGHQPQPGVIAQRVMQMPEHTHFSAIVKGVDKGSPRGAESYPLLSTRVYEKPQRADGPVLAFSHQQSRHARRNVRAPKDIQGRRTA